MACIASWQPRPGRNPYDRDSNRASHSGSSAPTVRACNALSAITGTVASYGASCQGMLGLGLDPGRQMDGVGDALVAGGLNLGREVDVLSAAGSAAPRQMAFGRPVVDDVGLDPERRCHLGDAALAGGGSTRVDVGV